MIIKKLHLLAIFFFLSFSFFAQKTAIYTDKYKDFKEGLELIDKEKYAVAQEKFEKIIASIDDTQDEIRIKSEFNRALCALNLFNKDAEFLLKDFAKTHADHPKAKKVPFLLGKEYFRQKKYGESIEWYEKVDPFYLEAYEITEYHFKIGYCYFHARRFDEAKKHFYEIKEIRSDYFAPTNYYYGHIMYREGNYQTALESFQRIADDDNFKTVVPYYIAQILYNQGKYVDVISYAEPLLTDKDIDASKRDDVSGLVGSSYFQQKQYKNAIPYLEDFISKADEKTPSDYYQIGYSYYKIEDYSNAVKYLSRVTGKKDEMAQIAYYHLAESYLKLDKKEYAIKAYKEASELDFDKKIQEDAFFGYAKLTYETAYNPYDGAINAFHDFLEKYPDSPKKNEAYEYLIKVYTTTKNYEEALKSLERIKDKNHQLKKAFQLVSYNYGVELYYKNDIKNAIVHFQNVNKFPIDQSLSAQSIYWIGEAYYQEGQYQKAIGKFTDFRKTNGAYSSPLYATSEYNIGYAYFNVKDFDKSASFFRNFVTTPDKKDPEKISDAYLRLGDAYYVQKDDQQAIKYYNYAIANGATKSDYALMQKALTLGYLKNYPSKEDALTALLQNYPNSPYTDQAIYELANTYRLQNKNDQALQYYDQIIKNYPDNERKRKALLNIGGIYSRENNYIKAEEVFVKIARDYPNSEEKDAAIYELEKLYLAQNKIDQFPDLLTSLGVNYSQSKLDSTLWDPAYRSYLNGDCENAKKGFASYISKLPNPIHKTEAKYYMAECYHLAKEYEQALVNYEYVIAQNGNPFMEKALDFATQIYYQQKEYQKAILHYEKMKLLAVNEDNKQKSIVGLMRCHYYMEDVKKAQSYAVSVINSSSSKDNEKEQAYLIRGLANMMDNNQTFAINDFKYVVKNSNNINKAIAKYNIASAYYLMNDYAQAEKEIFDFTKQKPTYSYWLAKGFILLADVYTYRPEPDYFQAKATLQSIIDGYTENDDIVSTALVKKQGIINIENGSNSNSKPKDFEIKVE